jgi:aldehyde dehydrogenase (NAD+)
MSAMQTQVLMESFHEAGLPPGVINFVNGLGEAVGTELPNSPDVAKIAFTGSTQIGKLVAKSALDTMKRLTLELGGKSANIILDDADFAIGFTPTSFSQALTAPTRVESIDPMKSL